MVAHLDGLGLDIIVDHIFHGLGESEKNPSTRIGDDLVRVGGIGWKSIDTTAKDTEQAKVRLTRLADLEGGCSLSAVYGDVIEAKIMGEKRRARIWQKARRLRAYSELHPRWSGEDVQQNHWRRTKLEQ
jgi:hypothetical protein